MRWWLTKYLAEELTRLLYKSLFWLEYAVTDTINIYD